MDLETIERVLAQVLGDDDASADRDRHIPTGLRELDDVLAGGLRTGQTTIVASRAGDGASTFALHLARWTALHQRLPICLVAPDTPEREIVLRLLAAETKVPSLSLRSGALTPRDQERLRLHRERLSKAPITINAGSPKVWAPEVFLDSLDYTTAHPGVRLAVVDDAGRLGPALRSVLAEMNLLARTRHFALVLVTGAHSQTGSASNGPPVLEELRDHDSISDLVDLVLMLHRTEPGEATVEIVKHRYGPTATIPIGVLDHYCAFANLPT